MMKMYLCFVIIITTEISSLSYSETVCFVDTTLKSAVESKLGISDPNTSQMLLLTSLDANSIEVFDLTGLECASNLEILNLCCNSIHDISPISQLTCLTDLDLCDNPLNTSSYCDQMQLVIHNNPQISIHYDINPNPLTEDCYTDQNDLPAFISQWLETDCNESNNWCHGTDMDHTIDVALADLAVFSKYWHGKNDIQIAGIVAHRGASYLAPENTVAAVELAWQLDSDAVEIDVRLSSDDQVMVIHDYTTGRTAGGVDLIVSETDSAVLRTLDVGIWKGSEFVSEKIPFLDEIVDTVPTNGELFIEIKAGIGTIEPLIRDIVVNAGKISQVAFIGRNISALENCKQIMPSVPVHPIYSDVLDEQEKLVLIQNVIDNGFDGLTVSYSMVTEPFVEAAFSSDLKLYVFTINDPEEAIRLNGLRVDGIITDRPDWIKGQL